MKDNLHVAEIHTALDIFRFAVFFSLQKCLPSDQKTFLFRKIILWTDYYRNCQAQPQLQLQPWLKAEIALFSSYPPTHPNRPEK